MLMGLEADQKRRDQCWPSINAETANIATNARIDSPRSNPKISSRRVFKSNIISVAKRQVIKYGRDVPT